MLIRHLQTKMLIFIMLPMLVMLAAIIILNYNNTKEIYTAQLEANMKIKLQSYANDFNGFLLEKSQVAKDLASLSQTIELIQTAKYPLEDRRNDQLFMTTINDFYRLRTAENDKAIMQIFMGLEDTDEAYYDNWEKRKGTELLTIPSKAFQDDILAKIKSPEAKNYLLSMYSAAANGSVYKLRNGTSKVERKKILDIFKEIQYGYHATARSWYKDVKSKKEFCFSNPYIDTSVLKPVVSALMPVFDKENQVIGAVGADLLLDYLTEKIKELKIEGIENNYTFLIDNRGYYIAYAYPEDGDKYDDKIDVEDKKTDIVNKVQMESTAYLNLAATYQNNALKKVAADMAQTSFKMLTLANISKSQIKEFNLQNYLSILKVVKQEEATEEDYQHLLEILKAIPKTVSNDQVFSTVLSRVFQKDETGAFQSGKIAPEDFAFLKTYLENVNDHLLSNDQINLKNSIIAQIAQSGTFEISDPIHPKLAALGWQYSLKTSLSAVEINLIEQVINAIESTKSYKLTSTEQYEQLKGIAEKYQKLAIPDFELISYLPPKLKSVKAYDYYNKPAEDYYLLFAPIPSVKWSIGLYISKSQALKPVEEILRWSLILSGIAVLILITVIVMLRGVILTPIQALARGMKFVEKGQFDAKVVVKAHDEIGQMTSIYNSMLDGLSERDSKLNHLIDVSRTIVTETELQALLNLIMDKSTDLLEAEVGALFLYDKKKQFLHHVASKGLPLEITQTLRYETGKGVVGACAASAKLVNITDASETRHYSNDDSSSLDLQSTSILCVPMKTTTGETIGVMQLVNKIGKKCFDENDQKLLSALSSLAGISIENASALKEIKSTMNAFQLFVPPKFLKRIAKEGIDSIKVGNAAKETISIVFTDIRNFTNLSEKMTPEGIFTFLNEYMAEMNMAIKAHDGFIDKFIGDSIMALFDNPHADGAVNAGIAMYKRLREYNKKRTDRGDFPIVIGCGINTGPAIIGTLGSSDRMDSTVIGDCVNLASRLEGLSKSYGNILIISSFTKYALQNPENFKIRNLGMVDVKGKDSSIEICEVFDGDDAMQIQLKTETKEAFEAAVRSFRQGNFDQAKAGFEQVLAKNPTDSAAAYLCTRCDTKKQVAD